MDEEYGTYPKSAWFNFPCGQIKLILSNNYYQKSRTSPEVKVIFAAEDPDPVGFSYGVEARLKRGSFEYSFDNRKVLLDTSVFARGTFGFAKIAFRDFQTGGTCTCEQALLGYPTAQEGVTLGVYVSGSCIGPDGLVAATAKRPSAASRTIPFGIDDLRFPLARLPEEKDGRCHDGPGLRLRDGSRCDEARVRVDQQTP